MFKNGENQFLRLREKRMAEGTRQFNARGKSVVRCEKCQLADYACICEYSPACVSESEIVLLMHRNEVFKPTNTGRLIADVLPKQTHAFCWSRTEPDKALLALLGDSQRRCFIVFPEEDANHNSTNELPHDDKINTFILLDGTWKQGRRMLKLSRWLDGIPVLAFPESLMRGYSVRKSEHLHQLSTAEAGALCLKLANENKQANTLLDYFLIFNQHYIATRNCCAPAITEVHAGLKSHNLKD